MVSRGVAFIAFIINAVILPGLGSIIVKDYGSGIKQLSLTIGGFLVGVFGGYIVLEQQMLGIFLMLIGGLSMVFGWLWAMITSFMFVRAAQLTHENQ